MKKIFILAFLSVILISCGNNNDKADAYGNFDAYDITVYSQVNGQIISFDVEKGDLLEKDAIVGIIDTTQYYLQLMQTKSKRKAIAAKNSQIFAQIKVLEAERKNLVREQKRIEQLLKDSAATTQQLDNINGQIEVIDKKTEQIKTQNASVIAEVESIDYQIKIIRDLLEKCKIKNPIQGVVTNTYVKASEIVAVGRPIYRIAKMSSLKLNIYVSEKQLTQIKTGDSIDVFVDSENDMIKYRGVIKYISDKAEFTPKIVQTKEDRVNLVYRVEVEVPNDGKLKIGMPAEVRFANAH